MNIARTSLLLGLLLTSLWGAAAAQPALQPARQAWAQAQAQLDALSAQQAELSAQQATLAERIEGLKAGEGRRLPGLPDAQLQEHLQRAQQLAARLSAIDRAHQEALKAAQHSGAALSEALGQQMLQVQAQIAKAPAAERAALFEQLRGLAQEQTALNQPTAAASTAAPAAMPRIADELADALPEELRELADEAHDHAQRVRQQLAQIEAHLSQLKKRRRLLRATAALQRDDHLFAEGERGRRLVRSQNQQPGRGVSVGASGSANERPGGEADSAEPSGPEGTFEPNVGAEPTPPASDPSTDHEMSWGAGPAEMGGAGGGGGGGGEPPTPQWTPPPTAEPLDTQLPDQIGQISLNIALDPAILAGDGQNLSPRTLAQQIAAVEAQRKALEASAQALEARQRRLERRAAHQEGRGR